MRAVVEPVVAARVGAQAAADRNTTTVLVTFVLSQIMQLLLFVTPGLTGGSDGIAGISAVTLLGTDLMTNRQVLLFACGIAIGWGAKQAGGCTSGNGLSGTSMLSPAALVATATFFGTAIAVTWITKAVI